MKKSYFLAPLLALLFIPKTYAVCPLCTIAVASGVGLSRYLGIDDTIAGLWIGGLTVSMIIWTLSWFHRKQIKFWGMRTITILGYYALIVLPLFFTGIMGHALNKIWGVDKLLIGIFLGTITFFGGSYWYEKMKKQRGGKAHFAFQKIVMPIAPLILFSILFYFLTR